MATLTNTKIKDTYDGLLKTTDNEALDVSGVTLIEDGLGNASALSVGRSGNGVTVSGLLDVSGEVQGTSLDINGAADISGNLAVDTNTLYVDAANNRVGINKTPSSESLEVSGNINTTGSLTAGSGLICTNGPLVVDSGATSQYGVFDTDAANGGYMSFLKSGTTLADIGNAGQIVSGGSANDFGINVRPSNNLIFGTANQERMRIDSSGNVGINCSPNAKLEVKGNLKIQRSSNTETSEITMESGNFDVKASPYGYPIAFHTGTGGSSSERMRINSSGFLKASNTGTYYGSTNSYHEINSNVQNSGTLLIQHYGISTQPYGLEVYYRNTAPNNTGNSFIYCQDNDPAQRFAVRSNGGIANYQANDVNLSDERVKKDIAPLASYWDKFKDIEVVTFKYKDQTHDDTNIGFIAQQVELVAPEFVDTDGFDDRAEIIEGEEPLKAIYSADMYNAAIKVLQEAMIKIETLEAKVATLESQLNA